MIAGMRGEDAPCLDRTRRYYLPEMKKAVIMGFAMRDEAASCLCLLGLGMPVCCAGGDKQWRLAAGGLRWQM